MDTESLRVALVETYEEAFTEWGQSMRGVPPYKRFGDYLADRMLTTIADFQAAAAPFDRNKAWRIIGDTLERDRKRQTINGLMVLDDLEDCFRRPGV